MRRLLVTAVSLTATTSALAGIPAEVTIDSGPLAGTTGASPVLVSGSNPSASERYYGNNSREFIALPRTIGAMISYKF